MSAPGGQGHREGDARLREALRIAQFDANVARGECDMAIASATQLLRAEVDRLRSALERIADQGPELTNDWQHWSDIARDALDEDRG